MENSISIRVPITISYPALEAAVRQKMAGEFITNKDQAGVEVRHAQILDVAITGSSNPAYDLTINLKVSILRTLLKRDAVDLLVRASLAYDNERQLLYVSRYKVDSRTQSSFYNASLEVLANSVANSQILKRARVDLSTIINREVAKVNAQLETGMEIKGILLSGAVTGVHVQDINPQPDQISLVLLMSGNLAVEILDLTTLMQARPV